MLRKTVTTTHDNGDANTAAVAAKTDHANLAAATEAALATADQAAADQARIDADIQAKARARAKSGIRSFSGCVC